MFCNFYILHWHHPLLRIWFNPIFYTILFLPLKGFGQTFSNQTFLTQFLHVKQAMKIKLSNLSLPPPQLHWRYQIYNLVNLIRSFCLPQGFFVFFWRNMGFPPLWNFLDNKKIFLTKFCSAWLQLNLKTGINHHPPHLAPLTTNFSKASGHHRRLRFGIYGVIICNRVKSLR